nr:HNH/ENDO VII family nuclease [Clostridium cibarium]
MTSGWAVEASDNPIINNIRNRVPNEEVTSPKRRENAPISNKDGRPIEIHHSEQNPKGPFDEMHPSDHRYGENYQKNHPDYNEPSKIDRKQFRKDKRQYWENEWDNGRWNK